MCQQFFEDKSIRNKASCVTAVVHNLASLQIHALISLTGDLLVKIKDLIYTLVLKVHSYAIRSCHFQVIIVMPVSMSGEETGMRHSMVSLDGKQNSPTFWKINDSCCYCGGFCSLPVGKM
jgi:hypothetical protein